MLNIPGLKFDKSIKYLENQLNIQTNNKQLILDIITNIGLIINNNSSNNIEELYGVLDIANDFLQDISNNITTLEQLNLEISNITEELNGIIKEQAQNSKTKEYYIAALSNIKNHITQYTEKFQEFQRKLDVDNDDFNEFINDNNFKYTFDTVEDSSTNIDTYELTSFSVNDESTFIPANNEISEEEKESYNAVEKDLFKNFSDNIEYIETIEENITDDIEIDSPIDEETIENVVDEEIEVDIVDSVEDVNDINNEIVEENISIEEAENIIEKSPVENEKDKKINELTNEFKEVLTNIYNSNTIDLDSNSIITNYLKTISSTEAVEDIDKESETIIDETSIENTQNEVIKEIEEPVENIVSTEENIEDIELVETISEEPVKNVINIQHIKTLQQNVLSIYNDLSNIADNILNEYNAFSNDFPSLNTNVVPLVNNAPVVEDSEANNEITQPVENETDEVLVETITESPMIEQVDETPVFEEATEIEEALIEDIGNPIDNLVEETLDLNIELESINEEPIVEFPKEEIGISLEDSAIGETISIEDVFEDFVEDATIEEIETIDDIVEDALFNIIEEPNEEIKNIDTNTNCNDTEISELAYEIIVDEPIKNIIEENGTNEDSTIMEEFEDKEITRDEQTLLEIEDNFSNIDEEVIENTILEETITKRDGTLDFELNNLLEDELNNKITNQDIRAYHNPIKTTENKSTENSKKVVLQQNIINENTPAEEIIAHIRKAEDANKILLISETTQKVYLPYRISELVNYMDYYPNVYKSLQDVVEQEFVLSLNDFMKHPAKARFFETYNLIKNRSGKSTMQALTTAFKLYKNRFLNPAIIAACKSDYELNCYLDALVTDNLDSFNFFKVIYDIKPL